MNIFDAIIKVLSFGTVDIDKDNYPEEDDENQHQHAFAVVDWLFFQTDVEVY